LQTYLRLLRFASPYKLRIAAAIACMAVLSLATAGYVYLLGPALDFLFTGRPEALGGLARVLPSSWDVPGRLAQLERSSLLAALPVIIVGVSCVKGAAYFGQFYIMGLTGQKIVADVRRALFDRLLALSPGFYTRRHSGDLMSRFATDVVAMDAAISNAIPSYIRDGLTVIVMLASCFLLDWRMSLIAFGAIPITLFPIVRLAKRLKGVTSHAQRTSGELAELVQEALSGMRVVQSYGMEGWESERFAEANRKMIRIQRRSFFVRAFSSPLMEVMAAAGLAAAIWWMGGRILAGELEAGKFFSFVAAVLLLYTPVKQLGRVGQIAMQGAAAGERVFEILDAESGVPDTGTETLRPFRDAIRYEQVTFAYDGRPVLQELSLEIRRGEVVALVGASGGGKTTVANLLPRFWDPTGGRITIDGKDVRELTLASLRAQLALVTQETVLFNDSVRANIAYGRPEVPLREVERAARLAQAHEFIVALPQGYETRVGERGVLLSGGQRQRIAIARAFLKDAPILVLDEATSALDAESEREVQRALDSLMALDGAERRTTLVIAHRLSTVRNADRIVVLAGGRVVEMGTHDALVARGGEYARLHQIFEGEGREETRASAVRA
jgi:ATP-binding cassette, subfamily B, bacterial MsbA